MSGLAAPTAFASLLLLVAVLATDVWVYLDAQAQGDGGAPVTVAIGTFRVDTPVAWFVCCLVLWVVFFPLYLAGRGRGVS
jgi:hypothetical protein